MWSGRLEQRLDWKFQGRAASNDMLFPVVMILPMRLQRGASKRADVNHHKLELDVFCHEVGS